MLQKYRSNLLLACSYFLLIIAQHHIFFLVVDQAHPLWHPYQYFLMLALLLVMSFIKGPITRTFFMSLPLILSFSEMGHYSYYATPIHPSEIWLGLQVHEIGGVMAAEPQHVVIPLIMVLSFLFIGIFLNWKIRPYHRHIGATIFTIALFFFFPIYNYYAPLDATFGRNPDPARSMGIDFHQSFMFFMGKILPQKITGGILPSEPNSSMYLKFEAEEESPWDKIVLIVGESLATRHMSLYDYERDTTPFLKTQRNAPDFFYTTGISSGVNTDVSVSYLLNLAFGSPGKMKSSLMEHCLFKLAKNQRFGTHFLSIQTLEQLKYIAPYLCNSSIDDFRPMEMVAPHTPNPMAARDRDLIPPFEELLKKNSKDFIVLHQRGSHGPWALRSTPDSQIFEPRNEKDKPVADYDNSVVEFDLFMRDLMQTLKKSNKKTLVIYVSDHGEALGENGRWGHGLLIREAFEVPMLIFSVNRSLPERVKELPNPLTQYGLSLFLTEAMGLVANQRSSFQVDDFEIYGNDIDGFAGKARLKFKGDGKYDVEVIPY